MDLKCCDASGNPYLVVGALIACGLAGVDRELDLGKPVLANPATLSEDEQRSLGVRPLPRALEDALDALESDDIIRSQVPALLLDSYVAVKRQEVAHFKDRDLDYELAATG
jgi:glutamine synthetase